MHHGHTTLVSTVNRNYYLTHAWPTKQLHKFKGKRSQVAWTKFTRDLHGVSTGNGLICPPQTRAHETLTPSSRGCRVSESCKLFNLMQVGAKSLLIVHIREALEFLRGPTSSVFECALLFLYALFNYFKSIQVPTSVVVLIVLIYLKLLSL